MNTIAITEKNGHVTEYVKDHNGVIKQLYPKPFKYDEKYVHIYDEPDRKRRSQALQFLRLGFVCSLFDGSPLSSLIDCGYGNGEFLKTVMDMAPGMELYGHDISPVDPPYGIPGINFFNLMNTITDVITFWDCLEHFPDLSFVANLNCAKIAISLPWCHYNRMASADENCAKDWFADWHHRKPNEHLHHFDKDSLIKTMKMYGWKCIQTCNIEDAVRKRNGNKNILTAGFERY